MKMEEQKQNEQGDAAKKRPALFATISLKTARIFAAIAIATLAGSCNDGPTEKANARRAYMAGYADGSQAFMRFLLHATDTVPGQDYRFHRADSVYATLSAD